jgi:hypothetical protein
MAPEAFNIFDIGADFPAKSPPGKDKTHFK